MEIEFKLLFVSFFFLLLSLIIISCKKDINPKPVIHEDLLRMDTADARIDFVSAIRKKDFRIIGINGYSTEIFGIDGKYHQYLGKTFGIKMIHGTSDYITSKEQLRLQKKAKRYAEEYNALLFEYLKEKNRIPPLESK